MLSFKFYEIDILDGENISEKYIINDQTEVKENMLVDKLKNKINKGDFIVFSHNYFKQTNILQFGEIVEIANKKIILKTIPENSSEKSFILKLRYKKNFLKLSEDQVNNLVFNKLSK